MKKSLLFIFTLGLTISLNAQSSTTRALPSFNEISISGGFDEVILQEGDKESVTLDVKGIDAENIITEVKGRTLKIRMKNGTWYNFNAKLTVTYKKLEEIASSGSTDIEALSVIKGQEFEMALSGSGSFKGTLEVKELEVALSGSGKMRINGMAESQEFAVSGSGDIDASNLKGDRAEVAVSGSGNVKLGVKGNVKKAISGSGSVSYR
jgi:hypothetical protein